MNYVRKSLLGLFLLIVVIFTLIHIVSSHDNNTNETISKESEMVTLPNATFLELVHNSDSSREEIIIDAQKSIDRSLSILNIVAALMGALVGLITIIIVIAIAVGVFEYAKWKAIRNNIESDANIINELRNKLEKDANTLRNEIRTISPNILNEVPSSEMIGKLDELDHKLDLLEILGTPLNHEDYYNRSLTLYSKNKYKMALSEVETAIELKPNQDNFWRLKGLLLNLLGRYDDAIKAFDKAIELQSDNHTAWYNRACAYSFKENKEDMLADLKRSIELDETNKKRAMEDKDFEKFWDDTDFKSLVD